jgi:hypothetical protein
MLPSSRLGAGGTEIRGSGSVGIKHRQARSGGNPYNSGMTQRRNHFLWRRLKALFQSRDRLPPEYARANDVLAAIDAGGTPMHAAKINRIARDLGLEVAKTAPVEETIRRIRSALERAR